MPENQHGKNIGFDSPNEAGKAPSPKGKNYLLAIGIDDYAHCPKLYNAVKDVQDMVAVLTSRFRFETGDAKILLNGEATKRNIYAALEAFAEKVTPSDNFVLYFSGHGEYKKIFDLGYWIPVEAERQAIDQYIPNSEVRNILSAIKSHHTFLMVDSCFSGALFSKGADKSVALRKERDPSRWGLTAGRNEIVTDGKPGDNSPFAKSILYQLQTADKPIGVAELCVKVLEVVEANAEQTPRGEPLKVAGHQGGQFVFHLRQNEAADWKTASEQGSLAALQAFAAQYPEGKFATQAKAKIVQLQAAELWQNISAAPEDSDAEIGKKLQTINRYIAEYPNQLHYPQALDLGELLEYKRRFLQAKHSAFSLRKFLLQSPPDVEAAGSIREKALALLEKLEQPGAAAPEQPDQEEQAKKEAEKQAKEEATRTRKSALKKQKAEEEARSRQRVEEQAPLPSPSESFPLRRYAIIGGGVLVLLLAVWLVSGLFSGKSANNEATNSAADSLQSPVNLSKKDSVLRLALKQNTPTSASDPEKDDPSENKSSGPSSPQSTAKKLLPQMVPVEGGSFLMGTPESEVRRFHNECQHRVSVGSFEIGKYEITQAEWRAVMGTNPSKFKNCDDCPVEYVSWDDIQKFIIKLNKWHPGKNYRLPTEAEWEYAARGGHKMPQDQSMVSNSAGGNSIGEIAWYGDNSNEKTHPVGKKKPNALGLYDMSGNVWEWCQDTFKAYSCENYSLPSTVHRVIRGGGWADDPQGCRPDVRTSSSPTRQISGLGFRLAASAQ